LLSVGHRWSDIQDYTLAQFRVFCEAAIRFKAQEQAGLIAGVNVAQDGKAAKKVVDQLNKKASGK
jgi:hypothetical protein